MTTELKGARGEGFATIAADGRVLDSWFLRPALVEKAGKSATVLTDHPEGALAASEHVRFELPPGGGIVGSKVIHHFGDIRRVEASRSTTRATPTTSSTRKGMSPSARSCSTRT